MKININEEILEEGNNPFLEEYNELLINRITHSSMALETDLGDPDDSKNAIRLRDNMKAFKRLMVSMSNKEKLSEELIEDTANTINESSYFISNGYRKTGNHIADSNIPITKPENIEKEMKQLIYNYEETWKNMEPFEKEARFHIAFIRIHPFEDGNGRTSRLLLNFNLLRKGIAPVIITSDLIQYYQSYIRDYNVESMKNLFQIQSQRELQVIDQLYSQYKEKSEEENREYRR